MLFGFAQCNCVYVGDTDTLLLLWMLCSLFFLFHFPTKIYVCFFTQCAQWFQSITLVIMNFNLQCDYKLTFGKMI